MLSAAKPLVWAEVSLPVLVRNLRIIRSMISRSATEILAVVKADAYGHGMKRVARALAQEGVGFFGVASIEEAVELRSVCSKEKILALGTFHHSQTPLYIRHRIRPTISSLEDAEILERKLQNVHSRSVHFPVHVKIDTGMGRLGVWHADAGDFFGKLKSYKNISVEGLYTHFSRADHTDRRFTERQMECFDASARKAKALGFAPRYFHAANSSGLLRFKKFHFNLVRPGIFLYGIPPSPRFFVPRGLRPILSLKTRISFLKDVEKSRTLSYGATYRAPRDTRIATIPVGYSHGYRVGFSNKAFVVIRGEKCPVVGRVTMDQTLVDVGRLSRVKRWDEVTLIGSSGIEEISAGDLAELAQTIPYEIVCAIHSRIPRIYK